MKKLLFSLFFSILVSISCILNTVAQNCSVNAGINGTLCIDSIWYLQGNATGSFQSNPVWQIEGKGTLQYSSQNLYSKVTNYKYNETYLVILSAVCSDSSQVRDSIQITLVQKPEKPFAGNDTSECLYMNGKAVIPFNAKNEKYFWSLIAGFPASLSFSDSELHVIPSAPLCNSNMEYHCLLTSTNNYCYNSDTVKIVIRTTQPVNAGNDKFLNCGYSCMLEGSCPGNGTVNWQLIGPKKNASFSNIVSNKTAFTAFDTGMYSILYSVNSDCFSGYDTILIFVYPSTKVTTAQTVRYKSYCLSEIPDSIVITGNKAAQNETVTWEQSAGDSCNWYMDISGNLVIKKITSDGSYKFIYYIYSGDCFSSSEVQVTVFPPPVAPVWNDIHLAPGLKNFRLPVSSTQGIWTYQGDSMDVIIKGRDVIVNKNPGIHSFVFTVTSGCGIASSLLYVTSSVIPDKSNAGTDQVLSCGITTTSLCANSPKSGFGKWIQISGPNTALMSDSVNTRPILSNLKNGTYIFRWAISGGYGIMPETDDVLVQVSQSAIISAPKLDTVFLSRNEYKLPASDKYAFNLSFNDTSIHFYSDNNGNKIYSGFKPGLLYQGVTQTLNQCNTITDTLYILCRNNWESKTSYSSGYINCNRDSIYLPLHDNSLGSTWFNVNTNKYGSIGSNLDSFLITDLTAGANVIIINNSLNQPSTFYIWKYCPDQLLAKDTFIQTCAKEIEIPYYHLPGNLVSINGEKSNSNWKAEYNQGKIHITFFKEGVYKIEIFAQGDDDKIFLRSLIIQNSLPNKIKLIASQVSWDKKSVTISSLTDTKINSWLVQNSDTIDVKIAGDNHLCRLNNMGYHSITIKAINAFSNFCPVQSDSLQVKFSPPVLEFNTLKICKAKSVAFNNNYNYVCVSDPKYGNTKPELINNKWTVVNPPHGISIYYTYSDDQKFDKKIRVDTLINDTIDLSLKLTYKIQPENDNYHTVIYIEKSVGNINWSVPPGSDIQFTGNSEDSVNLFSKKSAFSLSAIVNGSVCIREEYIDIKYDNLSVNESISKVNRILIPNTFTPDNNSINDYFMPDSSNLDWFVIRIWNRWGILVYEGTPMAGWDGKYAGTDCPEDNYLFALNYLTKGESKNISQITGKVLLLRNRRG